MGSIHLYNDPKSSSDIMTKKQTTLETHDSEIKQTVKQKDQKLAIW